MYRYHLILPCDPIPQKRHRSFIRNGVICNFDPNSKDKDNFRKHLLSKNPSKEFFEELLDVEILFSSTPPKHLDSSQSKRNALLWNQYNGSHLDCDNLAKFVLDACNGILWRDDCQIVSLKATKIYSEKSFTKISIMTKNKANFEGDMKILQKLSPKEMQEFIYDCREMSKIDLEDVAEFLEGLESSECTASNSLVNFVRKNYPLIHKLQKEISKWPQEEKNV